MSAGELQTTGGWSDWDGAKGLCGTLNSLLYRWLPCALDLYPSVLSGYINLLPLAVIFLPSLPDLTGCPLHYLSRRTTGPSKSSSTSGTRKTAATCSAVAIAIELTLASTTASAAATMTPPGVTRPLFVGGQTHSDEMNGKMDYVMAYTRFMSFRRMPVRLFIFFIAYGRSIPPLVLQSCHRERSR